MNGGYQKMVCIGVTFWFTSQITTCKALDILGRFLHKMGAEVILGQKLCRPKIAL